MSDELEWSIERLAAATIAPRVAKYECLPATEIEAAYKITHPGIFAFEAISVGDKDGQAFLVPLDESGRKTAEIIINALAAFHRANAEFTGTPAAGPVE